MEQTPFYLRTEFLLSLALGALLGRWVAIWYVRLILVMLCAGLAMRLIMQRYPILLPIVPNGDWLFPVLAAVQVGLVAVIIYLIFFTPRPDIRITSFAFSLVPYQGRQLIVGNASFINNGTVNARDVAESIYVYRRPEQCATHPLTDQEIQNIVDTEHDEFINLRIGSPNLIADMVPVNQTFTRLNMGEALSPDQVQAFRDGKCIILFASRVTYSGNHFVDYFRYAQRDRVVRVDKFEQRH